MRFDQLPTELILKVSQSCDKITNNRMKFTNKINYKVVEKWNNNRLHKIIFNTSHCTIFANTFDEGVKLKHNDAIIYVKILACNEVDHLCITEQAGWDFFKLDNPKNFHIPNLPNIGGIRTLEMVGGHVQCVPYAFGAFLQQLKVQNLILKDCEQRPIYQYEYLSDQMISSVPGNVEIELSGKWIAMWSKNISHSLTDATLEDLVNNNRKCFKLKNIQTEFTLNGLVKIFKHVVEKNLNVDWDFGYIATSHYPFGGFEKSDFVKFIRTLLKNEKIRMEVEENITELKLSRMQLNKYSFQTLDNQATIVITMNKDALLIPRKTDPVPSASSTRKNDLARLIKEKRMNMKKNTTVSQSIAIM